MGLQGHNENCWFQPCGQVANVTGGLAVGRFALDNLGHYRGNRLARDLVGAVLLIEFRGLISKVAAKNFRALGVNGGGQFQACAGWAEYFLCAAKAGGLGVCHLRQRHLAGAYLSGQLPGLFDGFGVVAETTEAPSSACVVLYLVNGESFSTTVPSLRVLLIVLTRRYILTAMLPTLTVSGLRCLGFVVVSPNVGKASENGNSLFLRAVVNAH